MSLFAVRSVILPVPVLAQQATTDFSSVEILIIGVVGLLGFGWLGKAMSTESDKRWLQLYVVWGFAAKLMGSLARYYMVTVLYGVGDSLRYHQAGYAFARVWRGLEVPTISGGSPGTGFVEMTTGFLYAIYSPSFMGGFFIFATLCFIGQLLFYAAFRPWVPESKQKLYAIAVFFAPSLVFWPSSIGKDALMVLFLGLASYGASRMLRTYALSSLLLIAPGLYLAARIRPHVAAVLGFALVLALLGGKAAKEMKGSPKRPVALIIASLGAVAILSIFSTTFAVTLEGDSGTVDVGSFLEDVSEQTATGGSEVSGGAISSPAQFPAAVLRVLFRPIFPEGANPQMILSALEGTALLVLTVWKLPTMWRNRRLLRERSYALMCLLYTGGFIIGFSAILNLGILARQRVQVLPMFLAVLVALGWNESEERPLRVTSGTRHLRQSVDSSLGESA